ncbi:hypothetical protein DFJ74DRAFT_766051 [Hyaloraphidium curvatum]|nr:hypothetical protein DFJ74DRAFT_766051 [Hyaloraphidium curvatum]
MTRGRSVDPRGRSSHRPIAARSSGITGPWTRETPTTSPVTRAMQPFRASILAFLALTILLAPSATAAPASELVVAGLKGHGETCLADADCLAAKCCAGTCAAECGPKGAAIYPRQNDDDNDDSQSDNEGTTPPRRPIPLSKLTNLPVYHHCLYNYQCTSECCVKRTFGFPTCRPSEQCGSS